MTNDSDFCFYDFKGVIIFDLINLNYRTVTVYYRSMLLKKFNLSELQLFYFVACHGNDFIKNTGDNSKVVDIDYRLNEIRKNCKQIKDFKNDFKKQWNYDMTNELDEVRKMYSTEQVKYPISLLTTDINQEEKVRNEMGGRVFLLLLFVDALNEIINDLKYARHRAALGIILSPCIGSPLCVMDEFDEHCTIGRRNRF